MAGDDEVSGAYVDFHQLVRTLREQCPWDIEQTHQSLVPYLIEETYEVVDAIAALANDDDAADAELCEELGDLLFQIEFHATIAEQEGRFTIADVARGINHKLRRRHPHVFGDIDANDADTVAANWDVIKQAEKPERTTAFDGIAQSLPSASFASKSVDRATRRGFQWPDADQAAAKVSEELAEVADALENADRPAIEEEVGDLLLAAVVLARQADVDPESALRAATHKFQSRFNEVERLAGERGLSVDSTDAATLIDLWKTAKRHQSAPTDLA